MASHPIFRYWRRSFGRPIVPLLHHHWWRGIRPTIATTFCIHWRKCWWQKRWLELVNWWSWCIVIITRAWWWQWLETWKIYGNKLRNIDLLELRSWALCVLWVSRLKGVTLSTKCTLCMYVYTLNRGWWQKKRGKWKEEKKCCWDLHLGQGRTKWELWNEWSSYCCWCQRMYVIVNGLWPFALLWRYELECKTS